MRESSSANKNVRAGEYITMSERSSFPSSSFRRMKSEFGTGSGSLFRDSDPEDDTFFTDPIFSRPSRLRSRLGDSVFDNFPRRSTMRTFPSAFDSTRDPFGSSSSWRTHPSWVEEELRRSRGSSPSDLRHSPTPPSNHSGSGSPGTNQQQSFFSHRKQQDGATRGFRESASQTSRASTPGSERSDSSRRSKGNSDMEEDVSDPGIERHASVNSKVNSKAAYSAQRQPKVHHIPIRVEPRDEPRSSKSASSPPMDNDSGFYSAGFHQNAATKSPPPPPPPTGGEPPKPKSPFASPNVQRKPHVPSSSGNTRTASSGEKFIPVRVEDDVPLKTPQQAKTSAEPAQAPASPPPPRPTKSRSTPMDAIQLTLNGVEKLRPVVQEFDGCRGDKDYLYLDEMLTRLLIRLDYIETDGNSELRQARKAAIMKVNELIHYMEDTVAAKEKVPEVDAGNPSNSPQCMDVESRVCDRTAMVNDPKNDETSDQQTENSTVNGEIVQNKEQNDGEIKLSEDSGIASGEETGPQSEDTEKSTHESANDVVKSNHEPKKFKTVANVQLLDCDATVPSTTVIDGTSESSQTQPN